MKTIRKSLVREKISLASIPPNSGEGKHKAAHCLSDQYVKQKPNAFHIRQTTETTPVEALSRLFKQPIDSLETLGGGDNFVYLVNDRWIFRVPKSESAKKANLREQILLTEVSRNVTTTIPQYTFWDQDTGIGGYQEIEGGPLSSEFYDDLNATEQYQLAHDLASVISEIHSIAVDRVPFLPATTSKTNDMFNKLDSSLGHNSFFLMEDKKKLVRALMVAEQMGAESALSLVVLHNDLHGDNIIVNEATRQLSGIIDFSDAHVGPPMIDFCHLYRVNFDLAEQAALIYAQKRNVDPVLFIKACRAWATVQHAVSVIVNLQADNPRTGRRLIRAGRALNCLLGAAPPETTATHIVDKGV